MDPDVGSDLDAMVRLLSAGANVFLLALMPDLLDGQRGDPAGGARLRLALDAMAMDIAVGFAVDIYATLRPSGASGLLDVRTLPLALQQRVAEILKNLLIPRWFKNKLLRGHSEIGTPLPWKGVA